MWLPNRVVAAVNEVARIGYIDMTLTKAWNEQRKEGELRALTGWYWVAKHGTEYRHGFKTMTMAYSDAWHSLVQHSQVPMVGSARARLRLVVRAA